MTARELKRHGMRVSRVSHSYYPRGCAFALFTPGEHNGAPIEWRREFQYRREAYAKAVDIIRNTK